MTTMRIAGLVGKASTVSFLLTGALVSCSGHGAKVTPQTLRTCVDRWNQANMIGWGPGPANVAFRHPAAKEHSTIELPSRRQCIVATPAGGGTWTCVLSDTGAYWCPPLHEPTGPPLRALGKNAMIDRRGVLKPDAPLKGTHSTPPLAWARYPLVDGYIQPWTAGGRLRAGLHFKGEQRGRCFLVGETVRSGISCLAAKNYVRDDACFPQRRPWRRGDLAACSGPGYLTFTRWVITQGSDPPVFVPWNTVGGISLGGYKTEVKAEYGSEPAFGYRLHGGVVDVTFDAGRVTAIRFTTPYYRTKGGFGVGSRIPLGPCHRTMGYKCLHLWHGFMWNLRLREDPCQCWVKVGHGRRSLPATGRNFLKPWFFIDVRHGRIAGFYFASKFVD